MIPNVLIASKRAFAVFYWENILVRILNLCWEVNTNKTAWSSLEFTVSPNDWVFSSLGSAAFALLVISERCVTWMWTSVRFHLAYTRASVSTRPGASNVSVAPDTQVAPSALRWHEDQYESPTKKLINAAAAARHWGISDTSASGLV